MSITMRQMNRRPALLVALALLLAACSAPPTASPGASSAAPSAEQSIAISADAIRSQLAALQEIADANGGVRTAGTPGYEASVQEVAGELRDLGYAVTTPEFAMATFAELPGATIRVGDDPAFAAGDDFHAMIYSAGGDVVARVVEVGGEGTGSGGCEPADFASFPKGAIALVEPGPCFRRQVVLNAVEAGASALLYAHPGRPTGHVLRPTLLDPHGIGIPALATSAQVGDALREAAEAGTPVRIHVETEIGPAMVHNVIAESPASAGRFVMLGAHLDSVHDGPGINDNGSGVAALLEVARVFAEQHPEVPVRFAFWGGEEFGFLGSTAYVGALSPAHRSEIAAYLNLDMLGSLNEVPIVYDVPAAAPGSTAIADFLVGYLERAGIGAERQDIGAASDHVPFQDAGIPIGGIFSGANEVKTAAEATEFGGSADEAMDACYHLACDRLENVDVALVSRFAAAVAAAALALGTGEISVP